MASAPAPAVQQTEPEDGWIPWNGGEQPVSDDTRIDVRDRDGFIWTNDLARHHYWIHDGPITRDDDVVAYRLVAA